MSIYRYAMGGGTGSSMMGEPTGKPIEEQVEEMKSKILSALEGGANDKEIMMMVQESPLKDKYEFNWDNVEMKVEAYPIEERAAKGAAAGVGGLLQKLKSLRGEDDERFGPKDPDGQRGDMFERGGRTDQGGQVQTYAGQYYGTIMEDEKGKYGFYEDADGNKTKTYFAEDIGKVGDYVPDLDFIWETREDGTKVAKEFRRQ